MELRKSGHVVIALCALSCSGDPVAREAADQPASEAAPSWHEHIAPLLSEKCGACHRTGGIGPFSLVEYAAARPLADQIVSAVERGTMPPFLARESEDCTPRHAFLDDPRLSSDEQALLRRWAEGGAREGDPARAAAIPAPRSRTLEREDLIVGLPEPIRVDPERGDIHSCVVIDPRLERDVYITGRQVTPGNERILHHLVSYVVKPQDDEGAPLTRHEVEERLWAAKKTRVGGRYECFGGPGLQESGLAFEMLGAWAPGAPAATMPKDSGQPLPAGSLIVLDIHYHPTGAGPEEDSATQLALMFADTRPSYILRPTLIGNFDRHVESEFGVGELIKQSDESEARFATPAGAERHVEEMTWTFKLPLPVRVFGGGTHMHYVGRSMSVQLEHTSPEPGEPERECLINTPRWDYDWQRGYNYDASYEELPQVNSGDVLRLRCTYDNSRANPLLARALEEQQLSGPIDVEMGEDTLDEMCLAPLGLLLPNYLP